MMTPLISCAEDAPAADAHDDYYIYPDPGNMNVTVDLPSPGDFYLYKVDDDTWGFTPVDDWDSFFGSDDSGADPLDISGSYSVGTANLEIFDRIVDKIALLNDYVYYRSGQYDYVLVYGPALRLTGSLFFFQPACYFSYLSQLFFGW